jgi:hypothetical protein
MTEVMSDHSLGVIVEADNSVGYLDVHVFIAPPPEARFQPRSARQ